MKGPSEIVRDSLGFGKVEFERSRELPLSCWALPTWTEALYAEIRKELAELPRAGS